MRERRGPEDSGGPFALLSEAPEWKRWRPIHPGRVGLGGSELQRSKAMDGTWMIEVRKERVWVVLKGHLES